MGDNDHAVVIGISRYADAGSEPSWIGNLNGPDNDAAAVAAWLTSPSGGGLPQDNVAVIRSADEPNRPPHGSAPEQGRIEQALNRLAQLPPTAYENKYAGRRAYVYVSGHGIATQPEEAALVTAEAENDRPLNVLITSWIEWLFTAGTFEELVLWVDCCATQASLAFLKPCDRNHKVGPNAGTARRFVAYAAAFNKQAVEGEMSDGKWHGVFTWALLKGLEGATTGDVTSSSLRDYLHSNMSSFLSPEQRVAAVSQDPVFGTTDELTFGSATAKPKFKVTLRFPIGCVGKQATISVDASSPLTAETTLQGVDWVVPLEAGTYVAFVPKENVVHPFTINGGGDALVAI
jgi:hypothetical protein